MTRRRQRWSIQVDEYPPKGERMYGPRTVIKSHHPSRPLPGHDQTEIVVGNTEVDEIFIDGWLHIELMGGRTYWANIGGLDINVTVDKDGRAKKVTYRVEAEDGVEYVDD